MRVLITGANGQLGKELVKKLAHHETVFATSRKDLDITNQMIVERKISQIKPDIIIHAAAYTAVDLSEIDKKTTFQVNALGAFHVANVAQKIGAKMIYISTDYVFSGDKSTPYNEDDSPNPLSTYGMSKWLGERLVRSTLQESYIVRTSWLYGHDGTNFVKTMLKLAAQQKEVKVISDQIGSPTYTKDLVEIIYQLFDKRAGVYHVSNSLSCSWYQFARAIFAEVGCDPTFIKPVTTKEYGTSSIRPSYSVMNHKALEREGIDIPRSWHFALKEFISKELAK